MVIFLYEFGINTCVIVKFKTKIYNFSKLNQVFQIFYRYGNVSKYYLNHSIESPSDGLPLVSLGHGF